MYCNLKNCFLDLKQNSRIDNLNLDIFENGHLSLGFSKLDHSNLNNLRLGLYALKKYRHVALTVKK